MATRFGKPDGFFTRGSRGKGGNTHTGFQLSPPRATEAMGTTDWEEIALVGPIKMSLW